MGNEKIKAIFINLIIFIFIFLIVIGGSMLFIKKNLKTNNDFEFTSLEDIKEDEKIEYTFLNIPMQRETIELTEDGGIRVEGYTYPTHYIVPVVMSLIITCLLFFIGLFIKKINKERVL